MHAIKKLASQNNVDSEEESDEIEATKDRLKNTFVRMTSKDAVLSGLFQVTTMLGVGSFGIVMDAFAVKDITIHDLKRAQEAKIREEPLLKVPKRKYGSGSSSNNHADVVVLPRGSQVAIKYEYNIEKRRNKFQLIKEYNVLVELFNYYSSELEGFAEPYLFGCLGNNSRFSENIGSVTHHYHSYHFLVMERLGESVRSLFDKTSRNPTDRRLSLELTFSIARQLVTRLKHLHGAPISITHNDLKLDQLILGFGHKRHILYLVDFGLSLKYKDGHRARWGNRRYAARFRKHGISSPLTDLESSFYVISRLLYNEFPWDGIQLSETAKRKKISLAKYVLWAYVSRTAQGKCKKGNELPWLREFFLQRSDYAGNGARQLLLYAVAINNYCISNVEMSAEKINYDRLKKLFHVGYSIDEYDIPEDHNSYSLTSPPDTEFVFDTHLY